MRETTALTRAFWERPDIVAEFAELAPPDYWRVELAALPEGSRVLDLGCGAGRNTVVAAGLPLVVHACDVSAGMLTAARRAVAERAPGRVVRFEQASFDALPYDDLSFDAVLASGVLHNAPDPAVLRAAIGEIARVLTPGGKLLLNVFTDAIHPRGWHRVPGEPVYLDGGGAAMTLLAPERFLRELNDFAFVPSDSVTTKVSMVGSGRRAVLLGVFRHDRG
ncbi:class I SAM-dependent methyltransferase [Nocardia sp. N2S4-5]|uniref:class I SAM-dependent methyltransferase n=1 Tax=Nocardia sp. N2S4-5 TaxID=3351565 RepID=UPI0037D40B55